MVCKRCGLPLLGSEVFCPQCGTRIAEQPPAAGPDSPAEGTGRPRPKGKPRKSADQQAHGEGPEVIEVLDVPLEVPLPRGPAEPPAQPRDELAPGAAVPLTPSQAAAARRRARLTGPLGLGLLAGCLFLFILGLGSLGIAEGLRIRGAKQNENAAAHYQLGVAHLEKGEYEFAAAEFEWALRLRPDYPEAQAKLIEARSRAAQLPSPSPVGVEGEPSTLLAEGQAAYNRGAWDEAILKLEALQKADPNYEQAAVRRLLVGAYTNSGLKLVNEDSLEEAIRRFDQALTLQPDNPDAQSQRRLASLYQSGLSVWAADWQQAIKDFSAVYALKPDYKDTTSRLQKAYASAGDAAAAASAWCDAAQYYRNALGIAPADEIATKQDEAARLCASPTAVPGGTPVPSGTYVGIVGNMEDNSKRTSDWGCIRGRVVNAKGEGVPNMSVKVSAYSYSSEHTTDATGFYVAEFLTAEVTYRVELVDVPSTPVDVPAKHAWTSTVNFNQVP